MPNHPWRTQMVKQLNPFEWHEPCLWSSILKDSPHLYLRQLLRPTYTMKRKWCDYLISLLYLISFLKPVCSEYDSKIFISFRSWRKLINSLYIMSLDSISFSVTGCDLLTFKWNFLRKPPKKKKSMFEIFFFGRFHIVTYPK